MPLLESQNIVKIIPHQQQQQQLRKLGIIMFAT